MTTLLIFIFVAIFTSFICSILEAAILSLSPGYLQSLKKTNTNLYKKLLPMQENIERPLAAILSLNTVAHTVGATGAGAQAQTVLGNEWFTLFSVVLTLGILILSEIIPKSLGARYWKQLLPFCASVLPTLVKVTLPLVWVSEYLSKFLKGKHQDKMTREEVHAYAEIGHEHGALDKDEYKSLSALLSFSKVKVGELSTKAKEVQGIDATSSFDEAFSFTQDVGYSRIPVLGQYGEDVRGYILRDELLLSKAQGKKTKIKELIKPVLHVEKNMTVDAVFRKLVKRGDHMAVVINDVGEFEGIVTMEDIFEKIFDLEIEDEKDKDFKLEPVA